MGKGCVPEGKCPKCSGTGIVTQEAFLLFELQPGFPNGLLVVYQEFGHMAADGRRGDVEVTFLHQYPVGWKRLDDSLDLLYAMSVQLENLANGWSTTLNCVNGKTFEVSHSHFHCPYPLP
jgi:DnaJ-class molecular chaperone